MGAQTFDDIPDGYYISNLWLLADELSVVEAALLLINNEPQNYTDVERISDDRKPTGYLAARRSIVSAIRCKDVEGNIIFRSPTDGRGNVTGFPEPVYNESFVRVPSFKDWLIRRGHTGGYFFRHEEAKGFRDKAHPRYSAKLAAVVEAWEAMENLPNEPGTPKQHLAKWLRLNARRFGFVDDDGNINDSTIDSLAKVANWKTGGGAPKAIALEPLIEFPKPEDDEIPF